MEQKTILNDEKFLRQVSIDVDFSDKEYLDDIKKLEEYCVKNESFALASIQIGIQKRIIYLRNTTLDIPVIGSDYNEKKVLINPVIVYKKGHTTFWEACVSCLDFTGLVDRPYEIEIEYYDEFQVFHKDIYKGFESTVLCHEIDHLNGILHIDKAKELLQMNREERTEFRKVHPYEIISEYCDFNL